MGGRIVSFFLSSFLDFSSVFSTIGGSLMNSQLVFMLRKEIMKNAGVFRSFIQFVMIVFPSMTPSMFYSIPKPCCSLQTTPFPFSLHQQPPILNSSQSLLHPLFPHKPLHSTCFAPPCTDAVHFHQSPRNTHSACFTTLLTPLTSYIRDIAKLVANELVTCNACMYDIYGSAVLCVIMSTISHVQFCI